MTFEQFDKFSEDLFQAVRKMRDTKGKEYARSVDRFDNFNRLATDLQLSRQKVLFVYLTKHLDGIKSYVNSGKQFSEERIRGRIVDAITYLTLLAGMVEEDDSKPSAADLDAHVGQFSTPAMPCPTMIAQDTNDGSGRACLINCIYPFGHQGDHKFA